VTEGEWSKKEREGEGVGREEKIGGVACHKTRLWTCSGTSRTLKGTPGALGKSCKTNKYSRW